MNDSDLPYSTGKRRTDHWPGTKVRVYWREDIDRICMTVGWDRTESGRPRERVLSPGTTESEAIQLAEETATERKLKILRGEVSDDEEESTPLGDLLDRYHDSQRAAEWSEGYDRDQERHKTFFLQELGRSTHVEDLTPAQVERAVGQAGERRDWSNRTRQKYLKYIKSAVRWGFEKAHLYSENPIRGIDLPEVNPDTSDLMYSAEEGRQLLQSHEEIDFRVTVIANIAADTGRRLNAIRQLKKSDLRMGGDRLLIHFQKESDKGGRGSLVPVSDQTARVVADALEEKMVRKSEYLLPAGRIGYDEHHDIPISKSSAIQKIHEAEGVLEIPWVKGRAFHGLKRLHVTLGFEVSEGNAALVGDVTGNADPELLRQVYRQQNQDRIERQVDAVRARLEPESTRESTRDGEGGSGEGDG